MKKWRIMKTTLQKYRHSFITTDRKQKKKGKRKVLGVPQSQAAALPRHQQEEKTDKNCTNECKHTQLRTHTADILLKRHKNKTARIN